MLTVIDTGKDSLIGLFLYDLHSLDKLCRNILGSKLWVIKEECLAVDSDLGYGFTVCGNRSVRFYLNSRKLLEELFEHVTVRSLE